MHGGKLAPRVMNGELRPCPERVREDAADAIPRRQCRDHRVAFCGTRGVDTDDADRERRSMRRPLLEHPHDGSMVRPAPRL